MARKKAKPKTRKSKLKAPYRPRPVKVTRGRGLRSNVYK